MGTLQDSRLCRVCAEEARLPTPLFANDASSKILREKISFFLPIIVQESSQLPRVICEKCLQALDNVVDFFSSLNQGQIKLLDLILGCGSTTKKGTTPSWNGKKHSLFDKKYPSGVIRKAQNVLKLGNEVDLSNAQSFNVGSRLVNNNASLQDSAKCPDDSVFENEPMRFECLEPSCRLRFQNAQEIESHLKDENHSTMTLVVPSEVEESTAASASSRLTDEDLMIPNNTLEELKDFSLTETPANLKKGRKSHEHSLSLKNRIVGMTEAGMTATQIARRIPIPRTTIVSIVKKYLASGNVDNKARSGRPKVWTESDTDRLNLILKLNKKANIFTIWNLFNESRDRKISRMTIRRKLKELRESKRRKGVGNIHQVGNGTTALTSNNEGNAITTHHLLTTTESPLQNDQSIATTISLSSLTMDVPNLVLFQEQG